MSYKILPVVTDWSGTADLLRTIGICVHQDVSSAGQELAISVIEQCAGKLEPYINQFLISAISRNAHSQSSCFDHHEIIYDIYHCSPQFLRGVTPYMLEELLVLSFILFFDLYVRYFQYLATYLLGDMMFLNGLDVFHEIGA